MCADQQLIWKPRAVQPQLLSMVHVGAVLSPLLAAHLEALRAVHDSHAAGMLCACVSTSSGAAKRCAKGVCVSNNSRHAVCAHEQLTLMCPC